MLFFLADSHQETTRRAGQSIFLSELHVFFFELLKDVSLDALNHWFAFFVELQLPLKRMRRFGKLKCKDAQTVFQDAPAVPRNQ